MSRPSTSSWPASGTRESHPHGAPGHRAGRWLVTFGAPVLLPAVLAWGGAGAAGGAAGPPSFSKSGPGSISQVWAPLAYGDARIRAPEPWPVVYPGSDMCGPDGTGGVVLLGAFGTSSWCGPNPTAASAPRSPSNVVRFGPIASHGGPYVPQGPSTTIDGIRVYESVRHGAVSGTVYSAPALGVELMASGPLAPRIIGSLAPSVRDEILQPRTTASPAGSWRSMSFAGLRFAVPPSWPVARTAYAFGCAPTDVAFSGPSVTLATDTNTARLPCPYFLPARPGTNGLQIDQGSGAAPNTVPQGAPAIAVNGLKMYVDEACPFSSLVVYVDLPGVAMPVRITIGLGTARTAGAVLGSIAKLS